jgi:hypothetical protein
LGAAFFIALTMLCSYWGFRDPVLTGLAGLLLLGSSAEFWLPVTYHLTEEGAEKRWAGRRQRMLWRQVRRAVWNERGIFLSPYARSTRLERFRGLFIPFRPEVPANEVIAWVQERLQEAHRHATTG